MTTKNLSNKQLELRVIRQHQRSQMIDQVTTRVDNQMIEWPIIGRPISSGECSGTNRGRVTSTGTWTGTILNWFQRDQRLGLHCEARLELSLTADCSDFHTINCVQPLVNKDCKPHSCFVNSQLAALGRSFPLVVTGSYLAQLTSHRYSPTELASHSSLKLVQTLHLY